MKCIFNKTAIVILLFVTTIYVSSCKKEKTPLLNVTTTQTQTQTKSLPIVITGVVSDISFESASIGGTVKDDGGSKIIALGSCWDISTNPTINSNKTNNGTDVGSFTSILYGLKDNTTYYVRTYATNSVGTAYGEQITFKTNPIVKALGPPTVTTADISSITPTSAVSGGNITNDGGGSILAKGIAWSLTPDWYFYDNDTALYYNGAGSGSFVSYLSNLKSGTTYFVKAYAVNSAGISFGSTLSFTAGENIFTNGTVSDIDGNIYKTVQIGNQIWMAENLKTTKYNDGTPIPYVTDNSEWTNLTTGGYSLYNNSESYKLSYGALYNWYAVTDSRNLCPAGWHVPSDLEWTTLGTNLGGFAVAGGKLKEKGTTNWLTPNTGADNSSGWTGLPGGVRRADGLFVNMNFLGLWWTTSKASDPGVAISAYLNSNISNLYLLDYSTMNLGSSVRCVRN